VEIKFIADNNVGKLARWLRLIGYDTILFKQKNNRKMINMALGESRIILTKDSQLMKRRLVTQGRVRAMLVKHDDPQAQLRDVVQALKLDYYFRPFSRCLECNESLVPCGREQVQGVVPPHVLETHHEFTRCPKCRRVYWQGTHWQAMVKRLHNWQGEVN